MVNIGMLVILVTGCILHTFSYCSAHLDTWLHNQNLTHPRPLVYDSSVIRSTGDQQPKSDRNIDTREDETSETSDSYAHIQSRNVRLVKTTLQDGGCALTPTSHGTLDVDCSYRNLTSVSALPVNTEVLDLTGNKIHRIEDNPFSKFKSYLKRLDLSKNIVHFIANATFEDLRNLQELLLFDSNLSRQPTFLSKEMFKNLVEVKIFALTFDIFAPGRVNAFSGEMHNCSTMKIIHGGLSAMERLEQLTIDPTYLPVEEGTMRSLHSLTISITFLCTLSIIDEHYFKGMPNVQTVVISNAMRLTELSDKCFNNLALDSLTISGPHDIHIIVFAEPRLNLFRATSLAVRNVKSLKSVSVIWVYTKRLQTHVMNCTEDFPGLQWTNIQNLYLDGNTLHWFNPSLPCCLPPSLAYLSVKDNCISFMDLLQIFIVNATNLIIADASNQNNCHAFNEYGTRPLHTEFERMFYRLNVTNNAYKLQTLKFTYSPAHLSLDFNFKTLFHNLKYLDMTGNKGPDYPPSSKITKRFRTNFPLVEYVDVSNCNITDIHRNAFRNLTHLRHLDMSYNNIYLSGDERLNIFVDLVNLKYLSLSHNIISSMPDDVFSNTCHLIKLDLGHNKIKDLTINMLCLRDLQFLDVSHNELQQLSTQNMDDFDRLSRDSDITVDLTGNRFQCTCNTQTFLKWMYKTLVNFKDRNKYTCILTNGTSIYFSDLESVINSVEVECRSYTSLLLIGTLTCTLVLSLIISWVVYWNRWKLRYLYHLAKIQLPRSEAGTEYQRIFDYDAFMSYSSDDHDIGYDEAIAELETKANLHVCVHERDFKPGESIPQNISTGIHSSKRTILMISRSFINSKWCMYELNIAREESVYENRKLILTILLDKIPNLPLEVLDITRVYTYLEYPKTGTEQDKEVFWNKCVSFINEE